MFLQVFLHGLTFVTIGMIPAVKMDTVLVTHQLALDSWEAAFF